MKDESIEKIEKLLMDRSHSEMRNITSSEDIDLVEDLRFDSIMMIGFIVDLETTFNIEFDDDFLLMDKMKYLKNIISYIRSKEMCEQYE